MKRLGVFLLLPLGRDASPSQGEHQHEVCIYTPGYREAL